MATHGDTWTMDAENGWLLAASITRLSAIPCRDAKGGKLVRQRNVDVVVDRFDQFGEFSCFDAAEIPHAIRRRQVGRSANASISVQEGSGPLTRIVRSRRRRAWGTCSDR